MLKPLAGRWGTRTGRRRGVMAATLLASLLYVIVRPAYADGAVGGSAGSFLDFEIGGRPSGMGGAQVGSAAGITAQYWNPAALASLEQQQIGAMHATWLEDLNYEWIGYAKPISPKWGVGSVSIAYFHLPSLDGVDDFGNPTGSFNVSDMAFTVGLARPLGRGVSVGANLKAIRQNLADVSAMGPAMDFGASVKYRGTTFGGVVQNLGPGLSFDGSPSYPLPRQIRFGASREVANGRVLLASDFNMPSDYYDDIRVGAEVRAHPNVSLRLGYRHEFGTANDPATGMSFGLGFNFQQLNVDYAMTPSNDFDDVHRLSFGYSFGRGAVREEQEPKKKPEEKKPQPPPAPKGPPVSAKAEPPAAAPKPAPKPTMTAQTTAAAPAPAAPAPVAPAPAIAGTLTEAEMAPPPAEKPEAAKPVPTEYMVLLAGFQSKESAEAEVKALQLLGFRTKDAHIEKDPKRGGYRITLARMKSKGNADEMAGELQRMSFRATVEPIVK